jgi:hypothetical protein
LLCFTLCARAQINTVKPFEETATDIEFDAEASISVSINTEPSNPAVNNTAYSYIYGIYYHLMPTDPYEVWKATNDAIESALLLFFKSKESRDIDISEKLPFLKCSSSSDGLLKVYGWYDRGSGLYDGHRSIIQYTPPSGEPNAISVSKITTSGGSDYPSAEVYDTIYRLKESVYLLRGNVELPGMFNFGTEFVAVKIENNYLVPCLVFDNTFILYCHNIPYDSSDLTANISTNFENEPFWIKIDYPVLKNNKDPINETITENDIMRKTFEFIFNGTKFIGDYKPFHE